MKYNCKFKITETTVYEEVDKQGSIYKQIRNSPQISCTVLPEDKNILDEIVVFATNKKQKPMNISIIIRSLIRFGHKNKDELIFD